MINFNGKLVQDDAILSADNRAFLYADGVFETVKVLDSKILFAEDHYFRLMSAMRILRMEIPMEFTLEYFEEQIVKVAISNGCENSARARITVFRNDGGLYLPEVRTISFVINASILENQIYQLNHTPYEVDLYKDFYISAQLLSTIKSTNKITNITGSIFAKENGFNNCILLNEKKNVVEALQGNLFMLTGSTLITPPIAEGCINGVMRKQILILAKTIPDLIVLENAISPFDLQKADELFITNVIMGIRSITKYRKKEYGNKMAADLLMKLNSKIRLEAS